MNLKPRWIFALIALASYLRFQLVANAAPQGDVTPRAVSEIAIRVHNYSRVKSGVLLQAERAAGDILSEVGTNTNWVVCRVGETPLGDAACARPMTPLDFILNLLPRSMAQRSNSRNEVFGVAVESAEKGFGFYASVFYDNVKDCAAHKHLDLATLLGHVIAHELGHLLLGTHSHTDHGLMSASWSSKHLQTAERRALTFSSSETQLLQIAMMARRSSPWASHFPPASCSRTCRCSPFIRHNLYVSGNLIACRPVRLAMLGGSCCSGAISDSRC